MPAAGTGGGFSFGGSQAPAAAAPGGGFSFGSTPASAPAGGSLLSGSSGFGFGSTLSGASTQSTAKLGAAAPAGGGLFGAGAGTGTTAFGAPAAAAPGTPGQAAVAAPSLTGSPYGTLSEPLKLPGDAALGASLRRGISSRAPGTLAGARGAAVLPARTIRPRIARASAAAAAAAAPSATTPGGHSNAGTPGPASRSPSGLLAGPPTPTTPRSGGGLRSLTIAAPPPRLSALKRTPEKVEKTRDAAADTGAAGDQRLSNGKASPMAEEDIPADLPRLTKVSAPDASVPLSSSRRPALAAPLLSYRER